jgi:DNA-binding NarL/FixJ family response regulator
MSGEVKGRILIADAEQAFQDGLIPALEKEGYQVLGCGTGAQALELQKSESFDVLIVDWKLPDLEGLQIMEAARQQDAAISMIMTTYQSDVDSAVKTMKLGAADYLAKPISPNQILNLVNQIMEGRRVLAEKAERERSFEALKKEIASTLSLQEVLTLLAKGVVRIMGVKGSTLSLVGKFQAELCIMASEGLSPRYLEKGPIDLVKSIGETILKGEQVLIEEASRDSRVQYPEEARKEGIVSILSIPMKVKGRVMGALRLYTAEPRAFSEEELLFLFGFAEQGALAIQRARSYEEAQLEYESLRESIWDYFDDGWT